MFHIFYGDAPWAMRAGLLASGSIPERAHAPVARRFALTSGGRAAGAVFDDRRRPWPPIPIKHWARSEERRVGKECRSRGSRKYKKIIGRSRPNEQRVMMHR